MALFLFFSLLLSFLLFTTSHSAIGITYSSPSTTTATTVPPPHKKILSAISALDIRSVRLPDADPSLINAFAFTNTSLFLSISNPLLPALASNHSIALGWLRLHVLPFYPRSKISLISVGCNSVFESTPVENYSPFLLPAMRNLNQGLKELGINSIRVSTTFSFVSMITTAFPPSSAVFQQPAGELVIKPILQFLEQTDSPFLINLYPYNLYRLNSEIPIGFALFQDNPFNFRDDTVTGLRYFNLFAMMADAVLTAMAAMGYENIPMVVAETGWPSSGGGPKEAEANSVYAEMYLKGLVRHLKAGVATPLKKDGLAGVYVYELMDHYGVKDERARKWGILSENMTLKYNVEFSSGAKISESMGILLVAICFSNFIGI